MNVSGTSSYIGRLAPSPTGLLHLGHARTFWVAQQRALAAGGRLWLRDDDLDAARVRQHYAEAMREDMRWLGLAWGGEVRQSERLGLYREAMERLLRMGLAYRCACSRKDLRESVSAPHESEIAAAAPDDEPMYSGRCRPAAGATGAFAAMFEPNANYRFRIPSSEPAVAFEDACAGAQRFVPGEDFGDFVVWRKDGLPSYQLACVVDDAAMGITEVVRGRDLLRSTARQALLQRALGMPTPAYFHAPLLCDAAGVRLAKRHDALSLRALREQGVSAAEIVAGFAE